MERGKQRGFKVEMDLSMNYADQGSACRIRHQAMVMAIGCS